jgi:hypothetical protein
MSEQELSPMEKMLAECEGDGMLIGERVAGVLEFLTVRAVIDGPFYIFTDNEDAMTLIAAGDVTNVIKASLNNIPIKRWEDELDINEDAEILPFETDSDPGDEQDEPASESE